MQASGVSLAQFSHVPCKALIQWGALLIRPPRSLEPLPGSIFKRRCKPCKSTQNTLDARSKKQPALKKALKRKSPEDQASWFREKKRQKQENGRHSAFNFDDLLYEESQEQKTGMDSRERVHWFPYQVFRQEEMSKAEVKGELDPDDPESLQVFEQTTTEKWEKKLAGAERKKKFCGVWHVHGGRKAATSCTEHEYHAYQHTQSCLIDP